MDAAEELRDLKGVPGRIMAVDWTIRGDDLPVPGVPYRRWCPSVGVVEWLANDSSLRRGNRGRPGARFVGLSHTRNWKRHMDAKERRKVPALTRILALMCVRQSRLETLHRGLTPITHTGDYSDVVVVDADGRRIPWPEVSRFNQDEMRDLMREIVNKIYTFFVKGEDPDFQAFSDYVRPATYEWDKPKIDSVMMHHVKEYARGREENG